MRIYLIIYGLLSMIYILSIISAGIAVARKEKNKSLRHKYYIFLSIIILLLITVVLMIIAKEVIC